MLDLKDFIEKSELPIVSAYIYEVMRLYVPPHKHEQLLTLIKEQLKECSND